MGGGEACEGGGGGGREISVTCIISPEHIDAGREAPFSMLRKAVVKTTKTRKEGGARQDPSGGGKRLTVGKGG